MTVYEVTAARGVMATSGGWAYCQQVKALARRTHYTLLCGRYAKDRYLGYGLRSRRHLDWGNPTYLASLARAILAVHERVGGELVLIGVSYSGFGVATLASHHPELRPDRLIVIDSYLDLAERYAALPPSGQTAREIRLETRDSPQEVAIRNVSVAGLARLVDGGTQLETVWSTSPDEQREFNGATCDRAANAAVLQRLADFAHRPVPGWVTQNRHGHDLWDHGAAMLSGDPPGRRILFTPGGSIPAGAACG